MRKNKGYWSKEKCNEEALKYSSRSEFQKKSKQAYVAAFNNKWLNEICSHMVRLIKPNNYWNKERCYNEMINYNSISEFKKDKPVAYMNIIHNKWFNIDDYFIRKINSNNYWSKEKCRDEALKYNTRSDYYKLSNKAYYAAKRNKWMDEICNHMIKTGNQYKRCIYSYEFPDNNVYIGLTYNMENRNKRHISDETSIVFIHKNKTGLQPTMKQLTDYVDFNEASKLENSFVLYYKDNGWSILNRIKCGSLGSKNRKWNKEKCHTESLKYSYRSDFQKESASAYMTSRRNGWLNEICMHMIKKSKKK